VRRRRRTMGSTFVAEESITQAASHAVDAVADRVGSAWLGERGALRQPRSASAATFPLLIYQLVQQPPRLGVGRAEVALLYPQGFRRKFAVGFATILRDQKRNEIAAAIVGDADAPGRERLAVQRCVLNRGFGPVKTVDPGLLPEFRWDDRAPRSDRGRIRFGDVAGIFLSERQARRA